MPIPVQVPKGKDEHENMLACEQGEASEREKLGNILRS